MTAVIGGHNKKKYLFLTRIDYFLLKVLALSAFLFTFGARMRFPCQNPVFAEMGVKIANKGHDLLLR